jgi:hypothetical protein
MRLGLSRLVNVTDHRLTPEERRSLRKGIPIDVDGLERYLAARPDEREFVLELLRDRPIPKAEPAPDGRERVIDIAPGPRTMPTTNREVQALWDAIFARDNR